ncbi:peptidoglycan DD-metalloendopeptidase family protein [bacterium]|nr:peptidoglycan DD-metalloendopeptidase family protein [bacterium]
MHTVQKGETLIRVSGWYERDPGVLVALNELRPPYHLREGESLYIPPDNSVAVVRNGALTLDYIRMLRAGRGGPAPHKDPEVSGKVRVLADDGNGKSRIASRVSALSRAKQAVQNAMQRREKAPPGSESASVTPGQLLWPLKGRYVRGFRDGWLDPHKGVDIQAAEGTTIRAAAAGQILFSGKMGAYGRMVVIDHEGGFATLYAHTSRNLVAKGQRVECQQPIALVGNTGRSTGPHLHFELRLDYVAVDPEKYLSPFK